MRIQVLGPGCERCAKLKAHVEEAVKDLGLEATVEKVTDWQAIAAAGVMGTPALAIDGEVVLAGRVPSVEKLKPLLVRG